MQINIVTGNQDKFNEISLVLKEFNIDAKKVSAEFKESGKSLEEISMNKAVQSFAIIGKPLIVDDTGVFFDVIPDFPGIYARRVFEEIGFSGLLKIIEDKQKTAHFRTVVCFTDGEITKTFEGVCRGNIVELQESDDRPQFPYEKIFIPDGHEKRMCDFSLAEKILFSHRAKAVRKFCEFYVNYQKE
jgi:XTP/dITP diphosphohydrolase